MSMQVRTLYFAGGCFWGTEHFLKGVDGVLDTETGFANGHTPNPVYAQVYTDRTGYAETVRTVFDADRIAPQALTELYFLSIDPLSLNRQGHDTGTRYRTGVYWDDASLKAPVEAAFARERARFGQDLAVECGPLQNYYPADASHQDYLEQHPDGYCHLPLKAFRYLRLLQDARLLLSREDWALSTLANAAALLQERMLFFWTGFYLVREEGGAHLALGPFQGPAACTRIGWGKGVCGTAWKEDRTLVVPDVSLFPGHIACSALSRSEIVVPLHGADGRVTGVLDIDSREPGNFDETDARWLERLAELFLSL